MTGIRVEALGTEFEHKVWDALRAIPFGETMTYGEIAHEVGVRGQLDEVISACARNPIPLLIPSHRAVRQEGDFGNFSWGRDAKRFLQHMEQKNAEPFMQAPIFVGTRIYG